MGMRAGKVNMIPREESQCGYERGKVSAIPRQAKTGYELSTEKFQSKIPSNKIDKKLSK